MKQQTFINNKPTLYIVATPIGNLKEFTPRAIEILNSVSIIACEDTRTSKILLNNFKITTPLASYHKFNEKESVSKFIEYLNKGNDIALISDAGYPLVSDPGSILVNEVIKNGYNVTSVSGASAFLNALVASNFSLERFTFIGFLEAKGSGRKKQLEELKKNKETLIFYESPHRIKETLEDILSVLGDRKAVLARELTKKFEEYIRGNISELITQLEGVKGEIVLIIEGNKETVNEVSEELIEKEIKELLDNNYSKKEIVSILCDKYDLKKNYIYDLVCKK